MRILIIAATEAEIQHFLRSSIQQSYPIDVLITGVGMVSTAYFLTKRLKEQQYSLLLNVGIAGTFHKNTSLGAVVRVKEDCFAELGAQNDNEFLTLKQLNLGEIRFQENLKILNDLPSVKSLQAVNGITVNKVHGKDTSIEKVVKLFSPDVESMEGATVFFIAQQENVQCLQVRAISNLVEKRNKDNWNIPLAIRNLNEWLIQFINDVNLIQ